MSSPAVPVRAGDIPGRPSWPFAIGTVILGGLLMWLVATVTLMASSLFDGLEMVIAHASGLHRPWPPFAGGSARSFAGNLGALLAAAVPLAVGIWFAAGRRHPVAFLWALVVALLACAVAMLGLESPGLAAAVVAVVALRWIGYREDGSARPAPLPGSRAVALALALGLAGLGAVAWGAAAMPISIDRDVSPAVLDPMRIGPLGSRDLPAGDRVPHPAQVTVRVANTGPSTVVVQGVRGARPAGGVRVVGARRQPTSWSPGMPWLLPLGELAIRPGGSADVELLLSDPGCRDRRTVRLAVELLRAGGDPLPLTVPLRRCRGGSFP